jgi:hypothetical protein
MFTRYWYSPANGLVRKSWNLLILGAFFLLIEF